MYLSFLAAPKTQALWKMATKELREAILQVYKSRAEAQEIIQREKDDLDFLWSEMKDSILKDEVFACKLELTRKEVGTVKK